jgi:hypothetical protein
LRFRGELDNEDLALLGGGVVISLAPPKATAAAIAAFDGMVVASFSATVAKSECALRLEILLLKEG